jgi:hypothetical protein
MPGHLGAIEADKKAAQDGNNSPAKPADAAAPATAPGAPATDEWGNTGGEW